MCRYLEEILVEDDGIRELHDLDRPSLLVEPMLIGSAERVRADGLVEGDPLGRGLKRYLGRLVEFTPRGRDLDRVQWSEGAVVGGGVPVRAKRDIPAMPHNRAHRIELSCARRAETRLGHLAQDRIWRGTMLPSSICTRAFSLCSM